MLDTIFTDVVEIFKATFMSGDLITLAIAGGSVIVASLIMQRGSQIGSMTLLALVLFVVGGFVRSVMRGPVEEGASMATQTSGRAIGELNAVWGNFMGMQASTLLAYFVAFMVLIIVVFGLKSMLNRG